MRQVGAGNVIMCIRLQNAIVLSGSDIKCAGKTTQGLPRFPPSCCMLAPANIGIQAMP